MADIRKHMTNIPLVSLVAANCLPVLGVLFFGWDAFAVVVLYWAENLVVGFYNILKMATVKPSHPIEHAGKLFLIPFFTFHYGMFTMVHGVFVFAFFGNSMRSGPNPFEMFARIPVQVMWAIGALLISHGVSFVYNYLIKGEYKRVNLGQLMGRPYGRIVVMHIAILGGGFMTMALGSPVGILFVLVVLKTGFDVVLHLREHNKIFAVKNTSEVK